jgi:type II secretory pathway pseudopilin PulG
MLNLKSPYSDQGFTLLELAIYLVVSGLMTIAIATSYQSLKEAGNRDKTKILLKKAEVAIIDFALGNSRLPCPDTNGDGQENCASGTVGNVPFQTINLDAKVIDATGQSITYSLYRNGGASADLGVLVELKNAINGLNILDSLDFCEALSNAQTVAINKSFTSVSTNIQGIGCQGANDFANVAFLLASRGNKDADHQSPLSYFDQENSSSPSLCFASSNKPISAQYDDLISAVSFSKLFEVSCSYQ